MSQFPTINDVAERAGVHHSTVSRALNNSPQIRESTKQKVLKAARELGYRPNPFISILMRNRSQRRSPAAMATIALVHTFPTRTGCIEEFPLLESAFAAAKKQAESRGFRLEEYWAPLSKVSPKELSRILYARNIKGILLAPFPQLMEEYELDWERFATVAWGMSLQNWRLHRVRNNHFHSVTQAMDECHKLGYRRVGLVLNKEGNIHVGKHYEAAYLLKQRDFGVKNPPEPLVASHSKRKPFMDWFAKERPDAVISERRPHLIQWLRDEGLRIPRDVGVAGLICRPEGLLSGMLSNWDQQAIAGVNFVIDLLTNNDLGPHDFATTLTVDSKWKPGKTLRRIKSNRSRKSALH